MVQSGQLDIQRNHIVRLFQQLTVMYADLKTEISHITIHYPVPDDEFSLWEELELMIVSISGYVKQIQSSKTVHKIQAAIAHLQTLSVFAIPIIDQFYRTEGDRYPRTKSYLQLLDYLRLLTVEYLQSLQADELIPA
ncbi:MAG: hypothetical protein VKJ64_01485 [Leptolyngbyaceae bacterium]|nr:hypothetical protein [Leptolyngbyaceae bacterium]